MRRRIRILPDHLANQIAAGEVVERPASVVKELIENALDANASRIEISVRNGGKTEIRVSDDGGGMSREDAVLSIDRHATSKLERAEELAGIRTLGFRGEALPSLASVSRMIIESADADGDGTRLLISAGQLTGIESCSRRQGTTINVRNLFFNTPARAKFLRTTAAETRAIGEVVTVLALAHPEVGFRLESNERVLLEVGPVERLHERIIDLWGSEGGAELIPVAHQSELGTIAGLIERPHAARSAGRRGYLFVNGRSFSDRALVRAVDRGYHTTIAPGVRPSFFLFLDLPEGGVDVNVHPAKAEVRFRDAPGIEQLVEEAVRVALQPLESVPALGARPESRIAVGIGATSRGALPPLIRHEEGPAQPGTPDPAADQMSLFVTGRPAAEDEAEGDTDRYARAEIVRPVMWQVHNTYIFAETREGLVIVDQHSAHERVLYEELIRKWDRPEERAAQRLLFPLTVRLSPAEFDLVEQLRSLFLRIGYEIEEFGGRAVIVHSVPNPHPYFDAEQCLRDMIRELIEGSELVDSVRNQHERLALSYACKAAIKAGQRLSDREITELFDRLFATELPFHDVHGRPTVIQLSIDELHNRFRRGG